MIQLTPTAVTPAISFIFSQVKTRNTAPVASLWSSSEIETVQWSVSSLVFRSQTNFQQFQQNGKKSTTQTSLFCFVKDYQDICPSAQLSITGQLSQPQRKSCPTHCWFVLNICSTQLEVVLHLLETCHPPEHLSKPGHISLHPDFSSLTWTFV